VQTDDFGVEVSNLDGLVVLAVHGDIDLVSCPVLQTALDEFGPTTHVILDCARASFIDSAGISLLVEESQRRELSGGSLRLRNSEFPVRQVVELTGLIDLFEVDNGAGIPDLGAIAASTRFAPVSCSAQRRETGAASPVS
jgi:anti-anti-sigma factor